MILLDNSVTLARASPKNGPHWQQIGNRKWCKILHSEHHLENLTFRGISADSSRDMKSVDGSISKIGRETTEAKENHRREAKDKDTRGA